jgi:endonuclease-3
MVMARPASSRKQRAAEILVRMAATIPEPRCELDHANPWQLLIATMLSAQATDRVVNAVTPGLFTRWPTPTALAEAAQPDVEAAASDEVLPAQGPGHSHGVAAPGRRFRG